MKYELWINDDDNQMFSSDRHNWYSYLRVRGLSYFVDPDTALHSLLLF